MGLFSSKQQKEDKARILDKKLIEKSYENLTQALLGELSIGSKDAKITSINFPDRVLEFYTEGGVIRAVVDLSAPINLSQFFYLGTLPQELGEKVLTVVGQSELFPNNFPIISTETPDALPVLQDALAAASREALLYAENNFSQDLVVRTDFIASPQILQYIGTLFITPEDVTVENNKLRERLTAALTALDIAHLSGDDVSLKLNTDSEGDNPKQNFVIGMANAEGPINSYLPLATGFIWASILEELKLMIDDGRVTLVKNEEEFVLPHLDEADFVNTSTGKHEVSSEWSFSAGEDEDNEEAFDLEDTDGSFIFSDLEEDSAPTTIGADEDISELIKAVFKQSFFADRAYEIADSNSELESSVQNLDQRIIQMQENYKNVTETLEKKKIEAHIDDVETGSEETGVASAPVVDTETALAANDEFITLGKLEVERNGVNAERLTILNELLTLLEDVNVLGSEDLREKVAEKITGIASVKDVAFYNPPPVDVDQVDKALFEELTPEDLENIKQAALDADFEIPEEDIPTSRTLDDEIAKIEELEPSAPVFEEIEVKEPEVEVVEEEIVVSTDPIIEVEPEVFEDNVSEEVDLIVEDEGQSTVVEELPVEEIVEVEETPELEVPVENVDIEPIVYDESAVPLFFSIARKLNIDPQELLNK